MPIRVPQVLSVLVVAEHSLGIWGLLLAVPLTVFALDYCIRYPDSSVTEVREEGMVVRVFGWEGGLVGVILCM